MKHVTVKLTIAEAQALADLKLTWANRYVSRALRKIAQAAAVTFRDHNSL